MAGGIVVDSGAAKTGTGGGRGGVLGGAFSLSPAVDSCVDPVAFSSLGAASAVVAAVVSAGGFGNSWIICARQIVESEAGARMCITSSRRSRMYCSVSGHSALSSNVRYVVATGTHHSRVQ